MDEEQVKFAQEEAELASHDKDPHDTPLYFNVQALTAERLQEYRIAHKVEGMLPDPDILLNKVLADFLYSEGF